MLVYCNILGGVIYILICRVKALEIEVHSDLLTKDGSGDFLDANTLIVDVFNAIISPAAVGCMVTWKHNEAGTENKWITGFVSFLLIIQGLALIFGLQVKRVDFDWSELTNIRMPKIAKWSVHISMIVLPAIIVLFAIVGCIIINTSTPFLALNICS